MRGAKGCDGNSHWGEGFPTGGLFESNPAQPVHFEALMKTEFVAHCHQEVSHENLDLELPRKNENIWQEQAWISYNNHHLEPSCTTLFWKDSILHFASVSTTPYCPGLLPARLIYGVSLASGGSEFVILHRKVR